MGAGAGGRGMEHSDTMNRNTKPRGESRHLRTSKPNLLGVVVLLSLYNITRVRIRLFRCIFAGIMAGGLFALALSFYIFHRLNCWLEWLGTAVNIPDGFPMWYTADLGNRSVTFMLEQLTGVDVSLPLAVVTLGTPVAIFLLSKNRRFSGESSMGSFCPG
jgi:hypothetical protein